MMRSIFHFGFAALVLCFAGAVNSHAQVDEICGETGGSRWLTSSFVFGKVVMSGFDESQRMPKVVVILNDSRRNESRQTIDRSGNYCFREVNGSGGFLVVEVEGLEVARRSLPSGSGPLQQRQDFEIQPTHPGRMKGPAAINAKFNYVRNADNAARFDKAVAAERRKEPAEAVRLLKEIVTADPADHVAWAKLGSNYIDQNKLSDAEAALRKAIELRPDFTPAMTNLGKLYMIQKQTDLAIDTLRNATVADPTYPRAFQLLGEAYLLARKGTLGVEALNEAIRLDPIGMAECHLLMAVLYDRAGAKPYASREYKMFLEKVPAYPDRKKLERYIKDNPVEAEN